MKEQNDILEKLKLFFKNIFNRHKLLGEGKEKIFDDIDAIDLFQTENSNQRKNSFKDAYKVKDYNELKRKYIQGTIKEDDLTETELIELEKLLEKQVINMKKENKNKKIQIVNALLANEDFVKTFKRLKKGEINKNDLTEEQSIQIDFLYQLKANNEY